MLDHLLKMQEFVDPNNKQQKICYEGCVDLWEKDEEYRQQMFLNGHTR